MEDLIKREDAIEFAEYSYIETLTKEERIAWIMDIPSAEPKQGEWIPCSERLPEKTQDLLVTVMDDEYTDEDGNYHEKKYHTYAGDFQTFGGHWYWTWRDAYGEACMKNRCVIHDEEYGDTCIVAWMPLPEPWEGADDAED